MNNNLIKTDTIWYKIKSFFNKLFKRKSYDNINIYEMQEEPNIKQNGEMFNSNISLREEVQENNRKKSLAQKLLYGEIGVSELEDKETDEMIEYFTKDIQEIDEELLKIKKHILYMKEQLKNS